MPPQNLIWCVPQGLEWCLRRWDLTHPLLESWTQSLEMLWWYPCSKINPRSEQYFNKCCYQTYTDSVKTAQKKRLNCIFLSKFQLAIMIVHHQHRITPIFLQIRIWRRRRSDLASKGFMLIFPPFYYTCPCLRIICFNISVQGWKWWCFIVVFPVIIVLKPQDTSVLSNKLPIHRGWPFSSLNNKAINIFIITIKTTLNRHYTEYTKGHLN